MGLPTGEDEREVKFSDSIGRDGLVSRNGDELAGEEVDKVAYEIYALAVPRSLREWSFKIQPKLLVRSSWNPERVEFAVWERRRLLASPGRRGTSRRT